MKQMNPTESLSQVGGGSPGIEEQAALASAAYGRIETEPDAATGLPAHDATLNWGGGSAMTINPGGPRDTSSFPANIAAVTAPHSTVSPEPTLDNVVPVPYDGFGDSGSWSKLSKEK